MVYNDDYFYITVNNIKETLLICKNNNDFSLKIKRALYSMGLIHVYENNGKTEYSIHLQKYLQNNRISKKRYIAFDRKKCKQRKLFEDVESNILGDDIYSDFFDIGELTELITDTNLPQTNQCKTIEKFEKQVQLIKEGGAELEEKSGWDVRGIAWPNGLPTTNSSSENSWSKQVHDYILASENNINTAYTGSDQDRFRNQGMNEDWVNDFAVPKTWYDWFSTCHYTSINQVKWVQKNKHKLIKPFCF